MEDHNYAAACRTAIALRDRCYPNSNLHLARDLPGVISQIDNMTAGMYRMPLDDYHQRRHIIRNILYTRMPSHIDANVCRAIADEILGGIAVDADTGKIGPGHICKHGVRWPHPCFPCDQVAWKIGSLTKWRNKMDDQKDTNPEKSFSDRMQDSLVARGTAGGPAPAGVFRGPGALTQPGEFKPEQLASDPVLWYFHFAHLPLPLRYVSMHFCGLAAFIVDNLPRNAERTVALRKLLEAKDAAVRANVEFTHPAPGKPETFFDRLIAEKKELDLKLERLTLFMDQDGFMQIDERPRELFDLQFTAMKRYSDILAKRIKAFEPSGHGQYDARQEAEYLDEDVRVTGGGKSEEPLPFRDDNDQDGLARPGWLRGTD